MSGFFDLGATGGAYVGTCVGYEDTYLSQLFVVADYYPIYLTCVMVGLTLTHFEVFYWLLTMVLFIDPPLNYGIRALVGPSDNVQPPTCPIRAEQMPAAGVQQIAVLWVVGWGMALVVFPRGVAAGKVAMFTAFASIALYTRTYLIFNSTAQMLAAAGLGLAEGIVYLALLVLLRDKNLIRYIVELPGSVAIGYPIDTMINSAVPTVHLPAAAHSVRVIVDGQ